MFSDVRPRTRFRILLLSSSEAHAAVQVEFQQSAAESGSDERRVQEFAAWIRELRD